MFQVFFPSANISERGNFFNLQGGGGDEAGGREDLWFVQEGGGDILNHAT